MTGAPALLAIALAVAAAALVFGWLFGPWAASAGAGAAVLGFGLWAEQRLVRPARRLALGICTVLESRSADAGLGNVGPHALGSLPEAVERLATSLALTRLEGRKAAEAESALVEDQKAWLETILQSLSEGVFVCNRQHRIVLYNRAAVRLVGAPDKVGLDRPLGEVLALAPLRHNQRLLEGCNSDIPSAPFACGSADDSSSYHGRMALLRDRTRAVSGYVLTLVDSSGAVAEGGEAIGPAVTIDLSVDVGDGPYFEAESARLPARPEFYDFGLMREHQVAGTVAGTGLRRLAYVAFDCEMTGLQPLGGDEIIQIGAVRVVEGRVLTGERFERLVYPGRPIPPASIQFHGLTDADVAGKPRIEAVLPEFRAYIEDAIMVGHNAAFDMKFLTLKQGNAGVRFDVPVLDTMLLSKLIDPDEVDHSLDTLAARYGVAILGRHTALGDAMATAELLLKLIDRLESRGLTTFGQVMKASNMAAQLRHRQAVVGRG